VLSDASSHRLIQAQTLLLLLLLMMMMMMMVIVLAMLWCDVTLIR